MHYILVLTVYLHPEFHVTNRNYLFVAFPNTNIKQIETLEDGTDTLSRNVGKQLPHDAA
jgi:hypothetical protein